MKTLYRSFAAGVITPELYGRVDLTKFQTGAAELLNMITLPHGPAVRRPGTLHKAVGLVQSTAIRLIPFAFSADETAVLEFGHEYIAIHVDGDPIIETPLVVTSIIGNAVTTFSNHGYSTGDRVYMGGRFYNITVTGIIGFTVTDLWGVAANPTGANVARQYNIASPYASTDLFDLHYTQDNDVLTLVHPGYAARELRRASAASWSLATISFAPSTTVPTGVGVVDTIGTVSTYSPQSYVVTAVAADGITESLASAIVSTDNNLTIAGNYNTVSWSAVTGASRYHVYKQRGGSFGYIGQTTSLSIVDDNVTPDLAKTPPEDIHSLNASSTEYPAAVTYYEQRRWFAGTTGSPQSVWATRNGTQSNLTSSIPSQDDDGMTFRVASRQQNTVRHLVPLGDVLAFTAGGEFRIFADSAPNITPSSLSVKPQGYTGASNVQPVVTSGSVLYVQAQGTRVREMAYSWQNNSYASIDISIMAPHLFDGYTIADIAFVRSPVPCMWAVRSDGVLLGMTYVPEQQVYAWHKHTTDGLVESVCVVSEGLEDALYMLIKRTINGQTVRYIERMSERLFPAQEDAYFVDCGMTYDGALATTITGLWHLEGETLQVLADGAVHPAVTVSAGSVTLEDPASVVHLGIGYVSDLKTLPLSLEAVAASGQYMTKNVNGIAIRVANSSVVQAGPRFDKLTDYPARLVSDDYDSPPSIRTSEFRMSLSASWNSDAPVCIRQDLPLPLTVLSMALDVASGG